MTISQPCDLTSQAMPRDVQNFVIASTKIRWAPGIAGLVTAPLKFHAASCADAGS